MSHKSSSIFSVVMAERDESLTNPPSPSHSHVYLPVIHALERRLLMPCLWYMTHHVPQRFIQWINPVKKREKKNKNWLPSVPRIAHNSFFFCVCSSSLILSPVSIMASPVKCYLTSAGLCVALSGVCHLIRHPHRWSWIWLWVGGLIIQADIKFCYFKMQGQSNFLFVVLNLSLRGDDSYKCCAFIKYTPDIRLYCHVFVQLWSGKWLTWLIVLTKFPSSWFDTEPLNNPEFLH